MTAGGQRQTAWRLGGGSYASAEDPRLHFGLGPAQKIEAIEVRWPSGRVDHFRDLPADTGYLIREAEPKPRPLAGFAAAFDAGATDTSEETQQLIGTGTIRAPQSGRYFGICPQPDANLKGGA